MSYDFPCYNTILYQDVFCPLSRNDRTSFYHGHKVLFCFAQYIKSRVTIQYCTLVYFGHIFNNMCFPIFRHLNEICLRCTLYLFPRYDTILYASVYWQFFYRLAPLFFCTSVLNLFFLYYINSRVFIQFCMVTYIGNV